MKTFLIFTCSLIFLHFLIPEVEQTGTIEVSVTNIEKSEGKIRAVLFRGEEGFPQERQKAFRNTSVTARQNKTILIFEDVPYGKYAISLLHDENGNGEMDTNIFGYPQEGYGVSNNNTSGLRIPTFENARFELKEPHQKLLIHLRN
jgi:uncharacterized protein (DUF2141 family)